MGKEVYKILKKSTDGDYHIPIFLNATADEMGVMVGFDGGIEQTEQFCNFSYKQDGNVVQVYLTTDPSKFQQIFDVEYLLEWGDGEATTLRLSNTENFSSSAHEYLQGSYTITLSIDVPWLKKKVEKKINVPSDTTIDDYVGLLEIPQIPYTEIPTTLNYINDLDYTNYSGNTIITFMAIGKSRVSEKKLYGVDSYEGLSYGDFNGTQFTGYTIDGLFYMDFSDGMTMITGNTANYTKEEIFNQVLTRNEHFLGFIDEPTIYSDVFIERGKQGVIEKTLRLSEIDNVGELEVYGNGFFTVIKQ